MKKLVFCLSLVLACCFTTSVFATSTTSYDALNDMCLQTSTNNTLLYTTATHHLSDTPRSEDPGEGWCAESWYETREQDVQQPTGWLYATVTCGGVLASGLINPSLGVTVSAVFGAGCALIASQPQYETVTVTQERYCERFWEYNTSQCVTQCTPWQ